MIGTLAFLERLPLAYVLTLATVAFAMVGFGLNQFYSLVQNRTTRGKLRFGRLRVSTIRESDRRSAIKSVSFGVDFNSIAMFPMKASLASITSTLGGRIGTKKSVFPIVDIDAFGGGYFSDQSIDITGLDISKQIDGELHYDITYGRSQTMHQHLVGRYNLHLKMTSPTVIEYFIWDQA